MRFYNSEPQAGKIHEIYRYYSKVANHNSVSIIIREEMNSEVCIMHSEIYFFLQD
jgi:hypothetical protein